MAVAMVPSEIEARVPWSGRLRSWWRAVAAVLAVRPHGPSSASRLVELCDVESTSASEVSARRTR
jgi:hypothetical protein